MIKPKYIEKNLDQKFLIKIFRLFFFYFFFPLTSLMFYFLYYYNKSQQMQKDLKIFFE